MNLNLGYCSLLAAACSRYRLDKLENGKRNRMTRHPNVCGEMTRPVVRCQKCREPYFTDSYCEYCVDGKVDPDLRRMSTPLASVVLPSSAWSR